MFILSHHTQLLLNLATFYYTTFIDCELLVIMRQIVDNVDKRH